MTDKTRHLIAAYLAEIAAPQLEPTLLCFRAFTAIAARVEPPFSKWLVQRGVAEPSSAADDEVNHMCLSAVFGDIDQLIADTKAGRYPAPWQQ